MKESEFFEVVSAITQYIEEADKGHEFQIREDESNHGSKL